ncbi:MAG TPA: twin-arginine translocation signal domain-containing protein [Candidatus Angelobacter sp.]|nr:twin-arginine translocation signal domain-containing protein [Candidatus Angelobacter sp.]
MNEKSRFFSRSTNRRSFLKNGTVAAGAATVGVGLLGKGLPAFAGEDESSGRLSRGDAAILRFLQALETIEADLWRQYAELGGATNQGISPIDLKDQNGNPVVTGLAPLYVTGLQQLDGDMPQYIADNTDDEFSHAAFLKAYLESKGASTVDLNKHFANLPPSKVTGVPQVGRLTNLTQLTIDTSWWTRYRSETMNPDFGDTFDQAVPTLAVNQHTAIPRSDADLVADNSNPSGVSNHTQAIASTAGIHFAFIEQGGSSLYPSLAQRVSSLEVLRILLSIGPTETSHFQTWHDKAGNTLSPPLAPFSDTDKGFPGSTGATVSFPNLNDPKATAAQADEFQTNLIMPEPTIFLNRKFPIVSIIRPTETKGAAMGAVRGLTADGLFIGQSPAFFALLRDLAEDADEARREL